MKRNETYLPMNVWLITAAEPIPSDGVRPMRFMGLADQLIAKGHEVTLWTTTFFHHTKTHRFPRDMTYEVSPDYRVIVLRSWGYKKNISIRRFLAHRHLAWRLRRTLRGYPKPDVILTSLPPLDTVSVVIDYGLRSTVPVVVDVIDPWPHVFLSFVPSIGRPLARVLLKPFYKQARSIIRNASAVSAISHTYLVWADELVDGELKNKAVFYPAVDMDKYDELTAARESGYLPLSERVRFVYAGALGRAYDLETVVACARLLEEEGFNQAEFFIAGNGPKAERLREMAKGLSNVELLGWLGAEDLAKLFAQSHVGLACYSESATQSVTYKLFDYLAVGLPILCSLPGEMSDIILRERVGFTYEAEDPLELASIIRDLCQKPSQIYEMGRRARSFAARHGDTSRVYREMAEFIESAVGGSI